MERQAGRNLDLAHSGSRHLQRRWDLGRHAQHQRCAESHWPWSAGAVLCSWCSQDLFQRGRFEAPGTRLQIVCSLCPGKGGGDLWTGPDAGGVPHCPGHGFHHHHPIGPVGEHRHDPAPGDYRQDQRCWLLGFHPLVGGDPLRWPVHHSFVVHHDSDGV